MDQIHANLVRAVLWRLRMQDHDEFNAAMAREIIAEKNREINEMFETRRRSNLRLQAWGEIVTGHENDPEKRAALMEELRRCLEVGDPACLDSPMTLRRMLELLERVHDG